jgi:hypothetical protein
MGSRFRKWRGVEIARCDGHAEEVLVSLTRGMIANQTIWNRFGQTIRGLGWEERMVIGVVGLAILIAVAIYVVRRLRHGFANPTVTLSEHLTDFRRMRDIGQIDEQEFHRVVNAVSQHDLREPFRPPVSPPPQPENPVPPQQGI